MSPPIQGRFTTGSTMRHVAVMTLAGSAGLFFLFVVDFAVLFFISLLGEEALTAGVGFAWAVQFMTASVGIGFSIAAMALVSRSIGARRRDQAREQATGALLITLVALAVAATLVIIFRVPVLGLIGATGAAGGVAADFLLLSVPSLPFVGMGMVSASILRADGEARRSMMVTMTGGAVSLVIAPLFIFVLDMGANGAALALAFSRICSALVGLRFCARRGLLAPPSLGAARKTAGPYFAVAGPAIATQLSTPAANLLITAWVADFGDSAVAGWAVASRLTVLAFGGVFALAGAIGGIIGQNYGAGLGARVAKTYRDALIFAGCYVVSVWVLLAALAPAIARAFGVSDAGAAVIHAFCYIGAGGFTLNGALFVASAVFNNLGRPLWSTGFNWVRDGALTPLGLVAVPAALGAPGAVYAQAAAGVLAGGAAVAAGWRLSHSIPHRPVSAPLAKPERLD